jgi:hypothetical protein
MVIPSVTCDITSRPNRTIVGPKASNQPSPNTASDLLEIQQKAQISSKTNPSQHNLHGKSQRTKWAAHHCPLGHAFKESCIGRGPCWICSEHPTKGANSMRRKCPSAEAKQESDQREAKTVPGHSGAPAKARKKTRGRRPSTASLVSLYRLRQSVA